MSILNLVGLALVPGCGAYLVVALLYPEYFE